jgi:hypothetical protein
MLILKTSLQRTLCQSLIYSVTETISLNYFIFYVGKDQTQALTDDFEMK